MYSMFSLTGSLNKGHAWWLDSSPQVVVLFAWIQFPFINCSFCGSEDVTKDYFVVVVVVVVVDDDDGLLNSELGGKPQARLLGGQSVLGEFRNWSPLLHRADLSLGFLDKPTTATELSVRHGVSGAATQRHRLYTTTQMCNKGKKASWDLFLSLVR